MIKKIAIITGHAGAIGSAMCKTFASNGYFVVGIDQIKAKTVDHEAIYDLCELANNDKLKQSLKHELHGLIQPNDKITLINNAAVQIVKNFDQLKAVDLNRSLSVNCISAFTIVKILHEIAKEQLTTLINISSIHSTLSKKNFLAYAVSKSALSGLTRSLSIEVGAATRVCEIRPAAIETQMLKDGIENIASLDSLKALHPSQSIGQPADVAKLALLIDQQPSAFLNGCIINLDGGISNCLHDLF